MRRAFGTTAFSLLLVATAVEVLGATRPVGLHDDVARSACWLLAVACTVWLAVTLLAYAAAIARADLASAGRAARFAPPVLRRALRTALVGTLAVAPVTSDTVSPPPVRLHAGADGRLEPDRARSVSTTTTPNTIAAAPRPPPPTTAPPSRHRTAITREHMHLVRPGDNLWSIARAQVARASGVERPSDTAIAPYWQRVVALNRATLRSGDPSLIFPGEIVALPNP